MPARFPVAPPARCILHEEEDRQDEGQGGNGLEQEKRKRRAGLTEGVEGAPVHGRCLFGVKEERGNLPAGQQVGIALRQREPLQLVS